MGSALTKDNIRYQLTNMKNAGLGGVHIIPIYGVKGYEHLFKKFLSPEWLEYYRFTLEEAEKLGLGVDITSGTGWPFGGPWVDTTMAAKKLSLVDNHWLAEPTRQRVKRASPGGDGYVLDPFSKRSMKAYLAKFDQTIAANKSLRSFYYDSYEVYGANWTDDFLNEFRSRRGYDLSSVATHFLVNTGSLDERLVKIDYQQTLSELLLETSQTWSDWASGLGFQTRYQAHGAPGNLLDLYAVASIPETEIFGSSAFPIPGLRVDPDYPAEKSGRPSVLAMKFASSAAHLTGRTLVSSETCTWLSEHFKVSLLQVKPQVDELFVAGINHVFFHGTTYSPREEMFPGWLFYASTNFGETAHFYEELPLLNGYIERCQEVLQRSKPDGDVLVYFPIQDIWADNPSTKNRIHMLSVHEAPKWIAAFPFGKLADSLQRSGYMVDFVSDNQLEDMRVEGHGISNGMVSYSVLLVPFSEFIPLATAQKLAEMAASGARIIFEKDLPKHITGFKHFKRNAQKYEALKKRLLAQPAVRITADPLGELKKAVPGEDLAAEGLSFIRKTKDGKRVYFIANLTDKFESGWVRMNHIGKNGAVFYDPLTNVSTPLKTSSQEGSDKVWLALEPGETGFVFEDHERKTEPALSNQDYRKMTIDTDWHLTFLDGFPEYNATFRLDSLHSWTSLSDTAASFSGTARYRTTISLSADVVDSEEVVIDLGDVRESAVVKINGQLLGTLWSIPFKIRIPKGVLKAGENTVEIDVKNLSANYMRIVDPDWKKFYDINMVDINYAPFDASKWLPMPSGLLTTLRLSYR